jgi:hypothetical protein
MYLQRMMQVQLIRTMDKIEIRRKASEARRATLRRLGPVYDSSSSSETSSSHSNSQSSEKSKKSDGHHVKAAKDPSYKKLKDAVGQLIQTPYQGKRKYYYVNIMKLVKTYT